MEILYNSDDSQVEKKSSIVQHKDKLSVVSQGEYLPISFDVLETVGCEGVKSHRAILSLNSDDIGYTYPVAECRLIKDEIVYFDERGEITKKLPAWYGAGEYQAFNDDLVFANADNGALGVRNNITLRMGLDYYQAKQTLPATE